MVVIYFDDVGSNQTCPDFKAYRSHSVAKQKPAPVIIYDYYDSCKSFIPFSLVTPQIYGRSHCFSLPARRAREFYNPPEISLCDICNGAEECVADCEHEEINVV